MIKAERNIVVDAPVDAAARYLADSGYTERTELTHGLTRESEREVVPERSVRLGEFGAA